MIQTSTKLRMLFEKNKELENCAKLSGDVLGDLREFNSTMPLIRVFSNKGLKERHWEEITELVGFTMRPN